MYLRLLVADTAPIHILPCSFVVVLAVTITAYFAFKPCKEEFKAKFLTQFGETLSP
jgi:hypothetical protein